MVRRFLRAGLDAAGSWARTLGRTLYRTEGERRVQPWFQARGDETLRLNYDLGPESLVLDLGGFKGQWASDIYAKYRSPILVFEPVPDYCAGIRDRFAKNEDVRVLQFGLAAKDGSAHIATAGDGSSLYKEGAGEEIQLVAAERFFREEGIDRVDLMKVNIEGGEYDLLDHLIETGLVGRIRDIQVQFHDFVPGALERMTRIQRELAKTHDRTWGYEFVWENWRCRE